MAIRLNKEGLTQKQIDLAEPILDKIAKYERMIEKDRSFLFRNPGIEYDKEHITRDRIKENELALEDYKADLEDILTAREKFNELLAHTIALSEELQRRKDYYGF